MAYTRAWDETQPPGTALAASLDTIIQNFKTDTRERVAGIFGLNLAQFSADPIVPISLTLSTSLTVPTITGPVTITGTTTGTFSGNLTGNVTGNLTGTVLTASQPNINSLGTLTALTVSGISTFVGDGDTFTQKALNVAAAQFLRFRNSANVARAYVGYGAGGSTTFSISNDENGPVLINTNGVLAATFAVGGHLTTVGQVISGSHVIVPATARMYLDGGSDTYLVETSGNVLDFFVGGTKVMEMLSTFVDFRLSDAILSSGKKLFLDGGGDTFIKEGAANQIYFTAGGVETLYILSDRLISPVDVMVSATKKLYLDGGGNTYIFETAGDILDLVVGGVTRLELQNTFVKVQGGADFGIDSGKKVYLDGISDTYIFENAANSVQIITGASTAATFSGSGVTTGLAFIGNLTGNVTGTVLTAAQANITSLGTLTALTISGDLTMTSATSRLIPGVTGFAHRNNANSLDNFAIADNGNTTTRGSSTVTGSTIASGGLNVSGNPVSFGIADSAGAGFRWLRVPN